MRAFEMQVAGGCLLGGGILFFLLSQFFLNKWYTSFLAESRQI